MSPIVLCYLNMLWASYRPDDGKFEISNIEPQLCTHLVYTFFGIDDDSHLTYMNMRLDLELDNIAKLVALKHANPNLKILAAVGGGGFSSQKFSAMASDSERRQRFVKFTVEFLLKHGFDGLDLDWEYPAQGGGQPVDRVNFIVLLAELKAALSAKNLLLTAAVVADKRSASVSYNITGVAQHVDFINLMTYDFSGPWHKVVGHNAPLKGSGVGTVSASVDYWLESGAPAHKLLVGIPFYGRTFILADSNNRRAGAPSNGAGSPGPYTSSSGVLGYNEICGRAAAWTMKWDAECEVPFAYHGSEWISFENRESIAKKAHFIADRKLGGAMIWTLDMDDFRGTCGDSYPLIKVINNVLLHKY